MNNVRELTTCSSLAGTSNKNPPVSIAPTGGGLTDKSFMIDSYFWLIAIFDQ